jgi:hypothetical protein
MKLQDECYFHPSIAIRNDSTVLHGRGMVVTQGISAGECIFVTPPTLGVGMYKLKKRFLEDGMKLEDVAIELLIDAMMEAITRRKQKENLCNAAINSFMALMGATAKQEKEVTVDLLNAKDDRDLWSEEELSNVTRTDLRNVILKNGTSLNTVMLFSSCFLALQNLNALIIINHYTSVWARLCYL